MDDENTAPKPAQWRTRFKDASASLWSWVERWNDPKARRAVRAGAWTVRALKWRERVVAYTANAQALRERAQESLGVLFSVAPFAQRTAPSNLAIGDEQNWSPPVPGARAHRRQPCLREHAWRRWVERTARDGDLADRTWPAH